MGPDQTKRRPAADTKNEDFAHAHIRRLPTDCRLSLIKEADSVLFSDWFHHFSVYFRKYACVHVRIYTYTILVRYNASVCSIICSITLLPYFLLTPTNGGFWLNPLFPLILSGLNVLFHSVLINR